MRAFFAAAERGYAIELDVRLSADDEVIVFHDATTDRCTGTSGRVDRMSLAQLRELRLLGTDERIPTLAEVLERIAGRVPLLIEIKREKKGAPPFEDRVWSQLRNYAGEYAVQSFHPACVGWFRKHAPSVTAGLLSASYQESDLPGWQRFVLRNLLLAPALRPSFIAYEINSLPCLPVTLAREVLRVPILAWTIRTEEELRRARKHADNVIFENVDPGPISG